MFALIVLGAVSAGAWRLFGFLAPERLAALERRVAVEIFDRGMKAWRTRPLPEGPDLWYSATRYDAALAAAWLRVGLYNLCFEKNATLGRKQYGKAIANAARFSPRDRAFAEAVAPLFEPTRDAKAAGSRLAALCTSDPGDGETCLWGGLVAQLDGDASAARAGFEDARRVDPDNLVVLREEGRVLLTGDQADQEAAVPLLGRCASLRPEGFDCEALYLQALEATCKSGDAERQAHLWARAAPEESRPYMHLIWALGGRRAPPNEIDDAVKQFADRMRDKSWRAQAPHEWAALRATWVGDFVTEEREALELAKNDAWAERRYGRQEDETWKVIEARLESGDVPGAKRAAAGVLDERKAIRAKAGGATAEDLDHSKVPMMLGLLREERPDEWRTFTDQRSARLASLQATRPSARARDDFWHGQFGMVPMTPDDAREAVAAAHALPVSRSMSEHGFWAADLGLALSMTGSHDEAVRTLRAAVGTCEGPVSPFEWMRAHLALAKVLEADGDKPEARALYKVIVDTWGGAKPRSVAADEARSRLLALGEK